MHASSIQSLDIVNLIFLSKSYLPLTKTLRQSSRVSQLLLSSFILNMHVHLVPFIFKLWILFIIWYFSACLMNLPMSSSLLCFWVTVDEYKFECIFREKITTLACEKGWKRYKNHWYMLSPASKSWYDAVVGYLLSIIIRVCGIYGAFLC